jgi:hypothetical protein
MGSGGGAGRYILGQTLCQIFLESATLGFLERRFAEALEEAVEPGVT